jgi:MFS family permease
MTGTEPAAARGSATGAPMFGITRGAIAATATMVSFGIAVSLLPPLLALTLDQRGVSERTIGLLVAMIALAALVTTPFVSRIARRFGVANVIAIATPTAAVLMIVVWSISKVSFLFPVIFLYGVALALTFTLSELWIVAVTPEGRRGFVMGLYATFLSIGFAIGPAILAIAGADSIRPFMIGAVLMALAALPALTARDASPVFEHAARHPFGTYIFAVPTATFGVFAFAIGESSGFAFLPLWGMHLGFALTTAPLLASAMTLGNVAFQIPVGLLADRLPRRPMLLVCAIVGALALPLAWMVSGSVPLLIGVLFIWGGATAGIYTVALAHLASRFSGTDLANANAALVFCYALGMLIGPAVVGDAMTRAPVGGFPLVIGTVFAVYAVIVALRIVLRRGARPSNLTQSE